jgi:transposase-like protein
MITSYYNSGKLLRLAIVVQESVVGIATRYGLYGPGILSPWGREFSHPSRPIVGPTQPPVEAKRLRLGVYHTAPSISEVKERVELYIYSQSEPSWLVVG